VGGGCIIRRQNNKRKTADPLDAVTTLKTRVWQHHCICTSLRDGKAKILSPFFGFRPLSPLPSP